ncbi:MAG TPA: Ppx/GppA phosphatase family protein [Vicinamibacterales bacterium]|nr:Ppx/GppA phosphatase family protein [Vicinamibacterales bacterium]
MRLAAIDIGTNSLHMIVVQVRSDLSFEVIDREKEMVRLGAGGLDGRSLTPEAMQTALQVMSKFKRLADSHGVDRVLAAATSAVREADNGGEFLRTVAEHTGIRPRVISGTEEARLIHLAAVYGVGVPGETAVAIDIGGGSVEITQGVGAAIELGSSFKVGVIRLTERFVKSDPISPRDERKLVRHIVSEVGDHLDRIVKTGFDRVIGTSGTILSLGAVAATEHKRTGAGLRNWRMSAKQLHRIRRRLVHLDLSKRLRMPGLDPRRADLAVAGAILLDTLLGRLGAQEITLCDLSLREGLILDYIARHRKEIAQADQYPDVRRRSVVELGERCHYWPEHAQQIARLSLALFDQTRATHGLTDREREWLEYASLLHDVGVHISYEKHHRHSQYLIQNGDLRGFEPHEVELIGLIARYHRQAEPRRKHEGFGSLPRHERKAVRRLAAILRLAESLDRSHSQTITDVELRDRKEDALLQLRTTGDAELELWAAARHAAPFERMMGKPLRLEVSKQSYVEQSDNATRVSRQAVRRGGHRRVGQDDSARAPGEVVDGRGAPGFRHRMELVRTRQSRH